MSYHIDFAKISLKDYANKLVTCYLPPSRRLLRDNIENRFRFFETMGIRNLEELLKALKKKGFIEEYQLNPLFTNDYLKILLREIKSLQPNPNKLADFDHINSDTLLKLKQQKITNTKKLFPFVIDNTSRKEFANKMDIEQEELILLAKLTDLSRIRWVGATFAQMLYDLNYDCVMKVSKANSKVLHKELNELNQLQNIFKGAIGLNDIKILIETANEVPIIMEFL